MEFFFLGLNNWKCSVGKYVSGYLKELAIDHARVVLQKLSGQDRAQLLKES